MTDRADKKPTKDAEIVWRFKDNKGWSTGFVREIMARGKVIHITDGKFSGPYNGNKVALADIEWHYR